jgi:hypothetical protein
MRAASELNFVLTREDKSHIFKPPCNVLFIISSQENNCINTKSHVIDIFACEDVENIALCIFQYAASHSLLYNKNTYIYACSFT